jgi:hypothetical protein
VSGALPHPNIQPAPGAAFQPADLEAIFSQIQENLDELNGRFPVGGGDLQPDLLRSAVAGAHKVNWGTGSLTWSASTVATPANFPHGLGATPLYIDAGPTNPGVNIVVSTVNESEGRAEGISLVGSISLTIAFRWIAIS